MNDSNPTATVFLYRAITGTGQSITGSLEAPDLDTARALLAAMPLEIIELEMDQPARPLRGSDFASFNQQLAYLTDAGLPVESGIRLIARETRSSRLARTMESVASDIERGQSLGEAFNNHRGQFPALYGKLIDAGVTTNNLPGMLFNVGRHLELLAQLRGAIWRATAYPMMVLLGLVAVLFFLSVYVFPQFSDIFADFDTILPFVTQMVIGSANWLPWVLMAVVAGVFALPIVWRLLRVFGGDVYVVDGFFLPLPLIGVVLRYSLVARWCDTVRLGVHAGIDLPRAIDLTSGAMGSPSLQRDGQKINTAIEQGLPLSDCRKLALIPSSVVTTMELACSQNRLEDALATLTDLYRQQAESRISMLNVLLMPILLVLLAFLIGFIVTALFLPLIQLMTSVM